MNSLLKKMGCRDCVVEYAEKLLRYYNGCAVFHWNGTRDSFFVCEFLPAIGCKDYFSLSDRDRQRVDNKFEELEIEFRLAAIYESLDDETDPDQYDDEEHLKAVVYHIRQTLDERSDHERRRGVKKIARELMNAIDLDAIHREFDRIFYKSELEQLDD